MDSFHVYTVATFDIPFLRKKKLKKVKRDPLMSTLVCVVVVFVGLFLFACNVIGLIITEDFIKDEFILF